LIVLIVWRDAFSDEGWLDIGDARNEKLRICQSIGFLFQEDDDKIALIQTEVTNKKAIGGLLEIPRESIISQVTISDTSYLPENTDTKIDWL